MDLEQQPMPGQTTEKIGLVLRNHCWCFSILRDGNCQARQIRHKGVIKGGLCRRQSATWGRTASSIKGKGPTEAAGVIAVIKDISGHRG